MKRIHVPASAAYDVLIAAGILDEVGAYAAETVGVCKAVIISDDTVFPLYGKRVRQSLQAAGFAVMEHIFPHGEVHKNLRTYEAAVHFLSASHITRSDVVIALGGGVVGDLAGFVAATYLRGIRYIQIPTTLLAMVDSSVGGKTAIDLDIGKNQVGCFYQPSLVLCDPEVLQSLSDADFSSGCGEVIKYALMQDAALFDDLLGGFAAQQMTDRIARCIAIKRDIVAADEFEQGERRKLNLGHTIGHAVERCCDFTMPHGQAVGIGLAAITRAAAAMGYCETETVRQVEALLRLYHLPTDTTFSAESLYTAALADKKRTGEQIHLVVPERIGSCRIVRIAIEELLAWLKAGV